MRPWLIFSAFTSLAGCAGANSRPPPNVPPPPFIGIDSEAFQKERAEREAAALREASKSGKEVTRTFIVGWEMHNGLFLVPLNSTSVENWLLVAWYTPDFRDDTLLREFVEQANPNASTAAAHLGQRLICHCTGVEWRYYAQKRFLVQSATLEWQ